MKIVRYLKKEGICVGAQVRDQKESMLLLSALIQRSGGTSRYRSLAEQVQRAQSQATFAIGAGVAIAQVSGETVLSPCISMITLREGMDYNAPDDIPVRLLFLIALPEEEKGLGSYLSVLLLDENLREQLMAATDEEVVLELLTLAENGEYEAGKREEAPLILAALDQTNEDAKEAASVLQKTAVRLGYLLRVEFFEKKRAPAFSQEELADAKGVLLMGNAQEEPFYGKPLLRAGITDGIYRPEHLLHQALKAPLCNGRMVKRKRGFWHKIKHFSSSHNVFKD